MITLVYFLGVLFVGGTTLQFSINKDLEAQCKKVCAPYEFSVSQLESKCSCFNGVVEK